MTDSLDEATRRTRRTVITLLVVTAVLLLPLLGGLWYAADDALQHKSPTDWRANHETKQSLERGAMLVVGLPMAGAACGWICATLRGRRARVPTAVGALIGTISLWVIGVVAICAALADAAFVF